ncbi:DUF6644 family protein [Sphingobium cloacae]|uniref:DUF6644 domain-containing protein n=1 Tax=Sphingobium cloacae TaxID=120107 RepID=A0A1E1EYK4_9SPHN|nr:DUF6644 family protein [Sphingobium cloacae]BAV63339.1 hypothetical protein SCLO_1002990 [Sphingobium cloacae]
MSITSFSDWLYATPVATSIRDTTWVIPTVQSIHILAIGVIVGSAIVSDLRLAGVIATDESPRAVARRYLPWMWTALVVLLTTGLILVVAEPGRTLGNTIFWLKMALVLFAFVLTLMFRKPLLDPAFEHDRAHWQAIAKPAAWISLVVWIVVIFCGRWIAYT